MIDDIELDRLLNSADPVRALEPDVAEGLMAMGAQISDTPVGRRRPAARRRLAAIGIVGAVALAGIGGVAAANGLIARTGRQASGGEDGTGEMIRIDAPDAPAVIAGLRGDIPLPPGITMTELVQPLLTREPTEQSESGLQATVEFLAACRWATYWLASNTSGDAPAMAAAQGVLDAVPSWPGLVASDVGGVVEMWRNIGNAARAMDPTALEQAGYVVNCTDVRPGT